MGHKYRQMGQLRESVEAYEQSLALRGSHLEEGDINVAQSTSTQPTSDIGYYLERVCACV